MAALAWVSLLGALGGQGPGWMFGPFEKPHRVNPVLTPDPAATFLSPVNDSIVRWEEYATFNPAAVVRDGKVYVLYRAEDRSGEMQIGRHTSRLGLAESGDGLRFTRARAPVLYPDKDAQAQLEWPGGVEDPRLIEAGDGTYRCLRCDAPSCEVACRYEAGLRTTAELVARPLGLERFTTAWQSAGRTADPWWGPALEDVVRERGERGAPAVVVCSAGFVADHLEILYDLDIEVRAIAEAAGMAFARTEMPNADPAFASMLADVVRLHLAEHEAPIA